jgi:hypothetical protein
VGGAHAFGARQTHQHSITGRQCHVDARLPARFAVFTHRAKGSSFTRHPHFLH